VLGMALSHGEVWLRETQRWLSECERESQRGGTLFDRERWDAALTRERRRRFHRGPHIRCMGGDRGSAHAGERTPGGLCGAAARC
jgi:hypothetical protein